MEVGLQSRSPEVTLLYLTSETSSVWTNKLELADVGWKVAGDGHGVDPLGISQALDFCFEQPRSQGSGALLRHHEMLPLPSRQGDACPMAAQWNSCHLLSAP